MISRGYYRMARGWMEHEAFAREPFTQREAWLWMIERAAWRDGLQAVGKASVRVQRGQLAASLRFLADTWGWPDKTRVERLLARLVRLDMVTVAMDPASKLTIVTLANYDAYQGDDDRDTNRDTESRTNAGVSAGIPGASWIDNAASHLGFPGLGRSYADQQAAAEAVGAAVAKALDGVSVKVDGQELGQIVTKYQSREAQRPPTGMSGFDLRLSPGYPTGGGF